MRPHLVRLIFQPQQTLPIPAKSVVESVGRTDVEIISVLNADKIKLGMDVLFCAKLIVAEHVFGDVNMVKGLKNSERYRYLSGNQRLAPAKISQPCRHIMA